MVLSFVEIIHLDRDMSRFVGYYKVALILLGIYSLFTREYFCLAIKRLGHRTVSN